MFNKPVVEQNIIITSIKKPLWYKNNKMAFAHASIKIIMALFELVLCVQLYFLFFFPLNLSFHISTSLSKALRLIGNNITNSY